MALNNLVFFDLETTSTDIFKAEIITGYFVDEKENDYYMKSQVDVWQDDAEKIHKISYGEMKTYANKLSAHLDAYEWLKKYEDTHTFICYANPNTIHGYIHYDRGVLINSFLEVIDCDFKIDSLISVHSIAREAAKRGLFTPIKGAKGRISFSQENVYKAIFNSSYNAHDAKSDVVAMRKLYYLLTKSLTNNSPITNGQTSFI